MFEVGDTITLQGFTGRISEVHKNKKIGFTQEKDSETRYTIVFENIPEHEIKFENGTGRRDSEVSPREKTKSD